MEKVQINLMAMEQCLLARALYFTSLYKNGEAGRMLRGENSPLMEPYLGGAPKEMMTPEQEQEIVRQHMVGWIVEEVRINRDLVNKFKNPEVIVHFFTEKELKALQRALRFYVHEVLPRWRRYADPHCPPDEEDAPFLPFFNRPLNTCEVPLWPNRSGRLDHPETVTVTPALLEVERRFGWALFKALSSLLENGDPWGKDGRYILTLYPGLPLTPPEFN